MMNIRIVSMALVALFAIPVAAHAADLAPGEIVVETREVAGSDVPEVSVRGVIDAKPAVVWAIVLDCENYEKVFSDIQSASKLGEDGEAAICKETVDMPFPLEDLTAVTRATTEIDGERRVRRWELMRGDYEMNSGSWTLVPTDGGAKTIATYTVRADPKMTVPGWLRDKIQQESLPGVIEDMRRAAASK